MNRDVRRDLDVSARQRVAVEVMAVEYLEAIEKLAAEFISRPKAAALNPLAGHRWLRHASDAIRRARSQAIGSGS